MSVRQAIPVIFAAILLLAAAEPAPFTEIGDFIDGDRPVKVRGDKLQLGIDGRRLEFSGKVVVEHPPIVLNADKVVVQTGEKGGILRLTAQGAVRITHEKWNASADDVEYDRREKRLKLKGHAEIIQGANKIGGNAILIDLKTKNIEVEKAEASVMLPEEAGQKAQ